MNNFGNFCYFFEIFTEILEQNIRKSQKICFLDGKEDKMQSKIRNFQIFEKISLIARLQPMIKLEVIMPYQQILQKYAYQGFFAWRIRICDENSSNPTIFMKKQKIENE